MDFDTIDWKKVRITLKLLKLNLPAALDEVLSQYTAKKDETMVEASANLLKKYHIWIMNNFETPEMDIALRMLFEEYLDENDDEEYFSSDKGKKIMEYITGYLSEKK